MRRPLLLAIALAVHLQGLASASAQSWPTRPVSMVVPFAPGGSVDVMGRILAARLSEVLGQQVVVENVPGAGGMIGSARVAKAAPDGYEFVLGIAGTHAQNQTLYKNPLYNAATDFAPVALIAEQPTVLVTRNDLPPNTLPEFIAYAKANQTKMQYGSAGAGSANHLACVLLDAAIGINVTHVPFRGGGPAMQELLGGRIDYMCNIVTNALPQIEAKSVKPIALLATARSPTLPSVASAKEQGLPDFDASTWYAVFLPKGTPAPIVQKLHDAVVATMDTPAVQARLKDIGADLVAPERRSPDYLAKFVVSEIARWAAPIKASGVSMD
ncbi:MAG TPA: tripartite tricarboxylate transporter substrate binding protein [Xanthobacteraceae bacterium]|jgi:tripartite-type tricarboxylate transporter receptor subunit TctC